MTKPTFVPTSYQNTSADYLNTKVKKDGALFFQDEQISITTGSIVGVTAGIVPFNAGCKIGVMASSYFSAALGASVTLGIGVIYSDNVANTDNLTLFASGLTAAAAGGALVPVPTATNVPYITTGDGWLVVSVGGATTGSTGIVYGQIAMDYFSRLGNYVTN